MKYCPHCQQWNHGRPMRCRYCGRTWNVRLCPSGHLNPRNANFCGECGSGNLSDPTEGQSLFVRIICLIKNIFLIAIVILLIHFVFSRITSSPSDTQLTYILTIILLVFGFNLVMKMTGLSFRISGRFIYGSIVQLYRWVSSIRIR